MIRKFFSCIFAICAYSNCAKAQEWSKEDSIWLQNVLEGKEVLKLNESTKKAIQEGSLIMPSLMKKKLDIIMDINDVGRPDPMRTNDPFSLPPAIFSLHLHKMIKMDSSIYSTITFTLTEKEKAQLLIPISPLSNMIAPLNTDPLHVYGRGNLLNVAGVLKKLIVGEKEKKKKSAIAPMHEFERERLIQEINLLRQSMKVTDEKAK